MKFNIKREEINEMFAVQKEFERAELNVWGKRFCPYCSYDLSLEE